MKYYYIFFLNLILINSSFSQKGPGGLGSTDGTSNLIMWMDADQVEGIVSGNNLTTWEDLSGYGNDASQSSPNDKPNWFSNAVNGFPYLRFDGDERLNGTLNNPLSAPATLVTVAFFDSLNQVLNDYVVSIGSQNSTNSTMNIARRESGADLNRYYHFDGININLGPVISGQTWHILSHIESSSMPYHNMYLNGASQVVDDFATAALSTNVDFRIADWANSPGGAFHFAGKVPEVILFDRQLNTAELNILHSYLGAKYDISNSNDKYLGDTPGNGDNDRNVIGIGTEADGSNNEAHSSGLQIVQNTGFENNDYILAGHAVKNNTINTIDVGGGYDARWDRAFYIDVTDANTTTVIDVRFDFSEAGLGSNPTNSTITNYQLIYRATGAGAWSTIATASSVAGNQVLFNGVTITLDGFYTLATLDNTLNTLGQAPTQTACLGPAGIGETDGSSNLKLWLNTQAMNGGNGDPLVVYNDYSGNNNHATLFGVNNIPLFSTNLVNGNDAISFDGTDYIEGSLDINLAADATVISVGYFNNSQGAGDNDYLISIGTPATANQHSSIGRRRNDTPADANKYYNWTGTSVILGPVINTATWNIFLQEQVTSGNFHNLFIDGVSQVVSPNPAVYSSTSPTYRIAMWQNANNSGLDGFVAETIIYDRQLNTAERNIINSYLGAKYDISVGGDQYTGDDVINGNNDIYVAGIGTEASGSNTCATSEGITITQNSNFGNGDYLIVGIPSDTNAVNMTDISEVTSTITARWERVWYADVTDAGAAFTTDLTFDFSDANSMGFPDGSGACYSLIYRNGTVGSWTIIATASSVSGDQVNFLNVPFVNDGYYTLATCDIVTNPLPIELLLYEVEKDAEQVKNYWVTASEVNNDYFAVQRSQNGIDFEEIGVVDGAGNSSSTLNYSYYDKTPYNDVSYYRLKQVDFNGNFTYSDIRSVNFRGVEIIDSYPNPASDQINFIINSTFDIQIVSVIYDSYGRKVFDQTKNIKKGFNNLSIDITGLAASHYFFKVETSDGKYFDQKKIYIK